jgi:glycosyltransferase involved in cell wall biosynthesis
MTFESLQIVMPVYNEGANILRTLREAEAKIKTHHSVLLVYDFDEDNTLPVVGQYIEESGVGNIALVKNRYGRGVLNALKTGFDAAEADVVLVAMADLSDDLSIVDTMFDRINEGFDIVCGSRYIKGGSQVGGPLVKKLLSWAAGISLHLITGIPTHDISNSFKMYRKSVLKEIRIESRGGFEAGMEIVVKAFLNGRKISEVPSTWQDRIAGRSRFRLIRWLPDYLRWYVYAVVGRLRESLALKPRV